MASYKTAGVVTGASISSASNIKVKSVLLTAAAADSTLVITDASGTAVQLNAKAGTSSAWVAPGGHGYDGYDLIAPITITTTGAASFARVDY